MKFSEQWLRIWVNTASTPEAIAQTLTMAGLEVDSISPVASEFSKIVVGEVVSAEKHPDADKLRVCEVTVAHEEVLQIVCGAANVRAGIKVPVALVGARLGADFKIKKSKLRGVVSNGMICSASELGFEDKSEGIMELPSEAPIGLDFRQYLQLDDHAIDVDLTPNRGDCLSVAGIAREIGALLDKPVQTPEVPVVKPDTDEILPVTIDAAGDCPSYYGRVITNIDKGASTPLWLQERLRRCGVRPISPVVDVTNYVMLELGQPMHAFDLAKLDGGVTVRHAKQGETMTTLDNANLTLSETDLVIADNNQPVALAGIMGGLDSAVSDTTSTIFLESAYFRPQQIATRARHYGIHSESSHRFERGVDFKGQARAIERATELLHTIVGGEVGPIMKAVSEKDFPERPVIKLRLSRLEKLIGMTFPTELVTGILTRLQFAFTETEDGWSVKPPSFRFDIEIEEDLVEEVARVHGYENIPTTLNEGVFSGAGAPESCLPLNKIKSCFLGRGYHEAISYSFADAKLNKQLTPDLQFLALKNPISKELGQMRTSLWASLIPIVQHNVNRQQSRVRLFEIGQRFFKEGDDLTEETMIAGVLCGTQSPVNWANQPASCDFYDMKGDVEALLALAGVQEQVEFSPAEHPALHPGQSASVLVKGTSVGVFGALHPALATRLDVAQSLHLFEFKLEKLRQTAIKSYKVVSKFPQVSRDLALVVAESVPFQDIKRSLVETAGSLLTNLELFDVFRGEGIPSGKRSLAVRLTWQHPSRTLGDEEVATLMDKIVATVTELFQAQLRG